ncbi:hypothetical protein [Sandarakinorhabdus cyanobacteriorum]|uniref:hypothetical protein n=1 Tax=Sandarakinorhabdus cyanobacteriorum TaxID=1981098 RepID=UPI001055D6E2|nr:hypothetical protein [Sandarakinorhabdus cyanobacteriorum]
MMVITSEIGEHHGEKAQQRGQGDGDLAKEQHAGHNDDEGERQGDQQRRQGHFQPAPVRKAAPYLHRRRDQKAKQRPGHDHAEPIGETGDERGLIGAEGAGEGQHQRGSGANGDAAPDAGPQIQLQPGCNWRSVNGSGRPFTNWRRHPAHLPATSAA